MFQDDIDQYEEIRALPTSGREIGREMFGEKYMCSFLDNVSTVSYISSNRTSLEELKYLRESIASTMESFIKGLSEEMIQAIPTEAQVQDYIPTQEFEDVCYFIEDNLSRGKMYNNILFWGPPGNGKSAFAKALAFVFQMPYRFEQGFGSKDAGDYSGTTIANNGVLNTSIETDFVKAMRDGGVFADDDFNYAKEAEQTFKNSILEAPYIAKLANQTEIHRNPFAIYIATANPDCRGARGIPEAFKNRCYIDMHWKPLSDELLIKHMETEADFHDVAVLKKMVECYHAINNAIGIGMDKKEEANNLTPRNLVFWANQTRVLKGNAIRAAEYNIIGALGSDASEQFLSQVRENMIKPRFRR